MGLNHKKAGAFGLASVIVLIASLVVFGSMNETFSFTDDFISKLGAKGEPNAIGWNLIGFVVVGLLLFVFGIMYGLLLDDKFLSILLGLFGLGFALTSIPMDMQASETAVSKAHIVAICLGLASWLFGLSKLGYNPKLKKTVRNRANITALLLVSSIIGFVLGFWSMPITHRLIFGIVFGWTTISSLELLMNNSENAKTAYGDHFD